MSSTSVRLVPKGKKRKRNSTTLTTKPNPLRGVFLGNRSSSFVLTPFCVATRCAMSLLACRLPIRLHTSLTAVRHFLLFLVMSNTIYFESAWQAGTKNISVFVKQIISDAASITMGRESKRTCIHTFSPEMFQKLLNMSDEMLKKVQAATSAEPVRFEPIPVSKALGIECKIQIIEALGEEEALKLGILSRDKVTGLVTDRVRNACHKKVGDPLVPEYVNGIPVYHKRRLVADDPNIKDIFITRVAPAVVPKPTEVPESLEGDDEAPF